MIQAQLSFYINSYLPLLLYTHLAFCYLTLYIKTIEKTTNGHQVSFNPYYRLSSSKHSPIWVDTSIFSKYKMPKVILLEMRMEWNQMRVYLWCLCLSLPSLKSFVILIWPRLYFIYQVDSDKSWVLTDGFTVTSLGKSLITIWWLHTYSVQDLICSFYLIFLPLRTIFS